MAECTSSISGDKTERLFGKRKAHPDFRYHLSSEYGSLNRYIKNNFGINIYQSSNAVTTSDPAWHHLFGPVSGSPYDCCRSLGEFRWKSGNFFEREKQACSTSREWRPGEHSLSGRTLPRWDFFLIAKQPVCRFEPCSAFLFLGTGNHLLEHHSAFTSIAWQKLAGCSADYRTTSSSFQSDSFPVPVSKLTPTSMIRLFESKYGLKYSFSLICSNAESSLFNLNSNR